VFGFRDPDYAIAPFNLGVVRPKAFEITACCAVVLVGRGKHCPAGALPVLALVLVSLFVFLAVNETQLPSNSELLEEFDKDSVGTFPNDLVVITGVFVLEGEADSTALGQELLVLKQVLERRFEGWLARILFDFVLVRRREEDIVRERDPETRLHGENFVLAIAVEEGPANIPSCVKLGPLGGDGATLVSDLELAAGELGGEAEGECADVVGAVRGARWVNAILPRGLATRSRNTDNGTWP
jgi:hypothetical protein